MHASGDGELPHLQRITPLEGPFSSGMALPVTQFSADSWHCNTLVPAVAWRPHRTILLFAHGSGLVMLEMHVSWPRGHGLVRISSSRPRALEWWHDGSWPLVVPVPFSVLIPRGLASELPRNTRCCVGSLSPCCVAHSPGPPHSLPQPFLTPGSPGRSGRTEGGPKVRGRCLWPVGCQGSTGEPCMAENRGAGI